LQLTAVFFSLTSLSNVYAAALSEAGHLAMRARIQTTIKDALQSVCKQMLCLHFGIQNIEFYSTTIYIFMILEYNKL
jgi:hypothetical protein